MNCPYCKYNDTRVYDSRVQIEHVRRRRVCPRCKARFTTHENLYLGEPQPVIRSWYGAADWHYKRSVELEDGRLRQKRQHGLPGRLDGVMVK